MIIGGYSLKMITIITFYYLINRINHKYIFLIHIYKKMNIKKDFEIIFNQII